MVKKTAEEFYAILRPQDRKDLRKVLDVLKEENLDVMVIGGAARATYEGRKEGYRDVDLLVRGNKEGYERAKDRINDLDMEVHGAPIHPYCRQDISPDRGFYGNIDVSYFEGRRIKDPGLSIDLLVNPDYRERRV